MLFLFGYVVISVICTELVHLGAEIFYHLCAGRNLQCWNYEETEGCVTVADFHYVFYSSYLFQIQNIAKMECDYVMHQSSLVNTSLIRGTTENESANEGCKLVENHFHWFA